MKNLITAVLFSVFFVACSVTDDENENNKLLLSEYNDPYFKLNSPDGAMYTILGEPDDIESEGNTVGYTATYKVENNGIQSYDYHFKYTDGNNLLESLEVDIYPSQENLNFIVGWLTTEYGDGVLEEQETGGVYVFTGEDEIITLAYNYSQEISSIIDITVSYSK